MPASVVLCHVKVFRASASDKAGKCGWRDLGGMTPDETTPAMQNPEKDPEDWTTGDEPMTGPQRSYLQTLCREAGEEFDSNLSKAAASKRIDELQEKTGRGKKEAPKETASVAIDGRPRLFFFCRRVVEPSARFGYQRGDNAASISAPR